MNLITYQNRPPIAWIWAAVSSKDQATNDKDSLERQEAEARTACEEFRWHIGKIMAVPGHSRDYIDLAECAYDMRNAKSPIYAFDELMSGWEEHLFDILVVRDGDRFGRTFSLLATVSERTIRNRQYIYSVAKHWLVDAEQMTRWIAFSGSATSDEIARFKKRRADGMEKRALNGLPAGRIPWAYRSIRDEYGKLLRIEVEEAHRRLFTDLAEVVLQGTPWLQTGPVMREWGHVSPETGKPFSPSVIWETMRSEIWWGHVSWGVKTTMDRLEGESRATIKHGRWTYDDSLPAPPGIIVMRNVHEPVYRGDLADALKSEFVRRESHIHGHARSAMPYPLTGLLICSGCKQRLNAAPRGRKPWLYWACTVNRPSRSGDLHCPDPAFMADWRIIEWLTHLLESLGAADFQHLPNIVADAPNQADLISQEIQTLSRQLARYVRLQGQEDLSATLADLYAREARTLDRRINELTATQRNVAAQEAGQRTRQARSQSAAAFIADHGVAKFFQMDRLIINQQLSALFGDARLEVGKKGVVGFVG